MTRWTTSSSLCVTLVLVATVFRAVAADRNLLCYPLGTIDFVRGLDLINLPPGVTESCDENDVIAYEVDKSAVVVVNFHNVIDKGHWKQLNLSYNATGVWPGNFSVGMRLRLWEDHADILNIYDSEIGHRFGISIGEEGVFLKFNGVTPAVQISSTNMVDWRFHRILLHFQGNRLLSRVSGPDVEDCGREVISELEFEERDREIPIHRSLVVLGREGDSAIEMVSPVHASRVLDVPRIVKKGARLINNREIN